MSFDVVNVTSVVVPLALSTSPRISAFLISATASGVFSPNMLIRPLLRIGRICEPYTQPPSHSVDDLLCVQLPNSV